MNIIYISNRSHDYVAKSLIEILRLSNRYKNGVVKLSVIDDNLVGPWDLAVVTGAPLDYVFLKEQAIFIDITSSNLKEIYEMVTAQVRKYDLA